MCIRDSVYTGADKPSRRQPFEEMRAYLNEHSHRIKYLCLHGLLAVDSVEYIIRQMQKMAPDSHSFILDMHQVSGISESAARLLAQARLAFGKDGIAVVYSRIQGRKAIIERLSKSVLKGDRGFLSFEDNDLAAEWCENRLLGEASWTPTTSIPLHRAPLFTGVPDPLMKLVEASTSSRLFAPGERILEAGQTSDGNVYIIESGKVSILVPLVHGAHQRVASLGPGMNFGEMVLFGQTTRSATVVADTETTCRILAADELDRISKQEPLLKIILLENLGKDMANSLRRATQWIAALA